MQRSDGEASRKYTHRLSLKKEYGSFKYLKNHVERPGCRKVRRLRRWAGTVLNSLRGMGISFSFSLACLGCVFIGRVALWLHGVRVRYSKPKPESGVPAWRR